MLCQKKYSLKYCVVNQIIHYSIATSNSVTYIRALLSGRAWMKEDGNANYVFITEQYFAKTGTTTNANYFLFYKYQCVFVIERTGTAYQNILQVMIKNIYYL